MTEPDAETTPLASPENPAAARARRGRNLAIALGLVGFVVLVYLVTVFMMGGNVLDRPL
jgi:hypothetical protein